jgi:hypothetical protein
MGDAAYNSVGKESVVRLPSRQLCAPLLIKFMRSTSLRWISRWAWRHLHYPSRFIEWWLLIFVFNLLGEKHPFWTGYVSGPWPTRMFMWGDTFLIAMSISLYFGRRRLRGMSRFDFLRSNASAQLEDWDLDTHWLPFDRVVELCPAPSLIEPHGGDGFAGWEPKDCRLRDMGGFFVAPRLEDNYARWVSRIDRVKLEKDGTKYVLINHPRSETDEHFVDLEFRKTTWSRVQACKSLIYPKLGEPETNDHRTALFRAVDPEWVAGTKPRMDLRRSVLPHATCLHGIVITADRKLLALQRPGPERTDYHPLAWSFSFEEQLADDDFNHQSEVDVSRWMIRATRQEVLGPEITKLFDVNKARVLTLAMEEPIFSPFIVAYIPVECDAARLVEILPSAADRVEWLRYAFYSIDPPFDLLVDAFKTGTHTDGHKLHPTSRFRIYLALSTLLPSSFDVASILRAERD